MQSDGYCRIDGAMSPPVHAQMPGQPGHFILATSQAAWRVSQLGLVCAQMVQFLHRRSHLAQVLVVPPPDWLVPPEPEAGSAEPPPESTQSSIPVSSSQPQSSYPEGQAPVDIKA